MKYTSSLFRQYQSRYQTWPPNITEIDPLKLLAGSAPVVTPCLSQLWTTGILTIRHKTSKNGFLPMHFYLFIPVTSRSDSHTNIFRVVCSLNNLWSFAASHSPMHFINRRTPKSLQHCIIIIMMASFIHMPLVLVYHQSKCISAIRRILFYYRHACILVFFNVLVSFLLLRCML